MYVHNLIVKPLAKVCSDTIGNYDCKYYCILWANHTNDSSKILFKSSKFNTCYLMIVFMGFSGSQRNFKFHSFLSLAFPAVSPLITLNNIATRLPLSLLSPPEDLPTELLQPPSK